MTVSWQENTTPQCRNRLNRTFCRQVLGQHPQSKLSQQGYESQPLYAPVVSTCQSKTKNLASNQLCRWDLHSKSLLGPAFVYVYKNKSWKPNHPTPWRAQPNRGNGGGRGRPNLSPPTNQRLEIRDVDGGGQSHSCSTENTLGALKV